MITHRITVMFKTEDGEDAVAKDLGEIIGRIAPYMVDNVGVSVDRWVDHHNNWGGRWVEVK